MKQTNAKIFIDSNIWIYLYSTTEKSKRALAQKLIDSYNNICISTQVLNELANVLSKKFKLPASDVTTVLEDITQYTSIHTVDFSTIKKALHIAQALKYSYYDSLIIASALQEECSVLISEDMHSSHKIENALTIKNPFE